MKIGAEVVTEANLDKVGVVAVNDGDRSSFTVVSGDRLLAVDANLEVLAEWRVGSFADGCHATSPGRGLALISGSSDVRLLGRHSQVLWRYEHEPWPGTRDAGCTWFDHAGEPYAVVPASSGCLVVRLDLDSGRVAAEVPINAVPEGIFPVHHPDGWVGLSEGEGQDAVQAWWIRSRRGPAGIDLIDGGWEDWVLADAASSGTEIITTPHDTGPLLVRSFPGLEVIRVIDPPSADEFWDFTACFAGELIIGKLTNQDTNRESLAAVDADGAVHYTGAEDAGWLIPGPGETWLTATKSRIRKYQVVRQ